MVNIIFKVNPSKALEAIVYIASKVDHVDTYHTVKTMFFADKKHLNDYARPILGDTYIKMKNGPVPSAVLDIINRKKDRISADIYAKALDAFDVSTDRKKYITPKREANLNEFSETDIECLDYAINFCKGKSFGQLKDITHEEEAWRAASENGCMDYELMLDDSNPNKNDIIQDLREDSQWLAF